MRRVRVPHPANRRASATSDSHAEAARARDYAGEHPPQAGLPRHFLPYILTVAVALAVLALVAARAPEAGEPLGLRWLRTCSDHPLRTLGALTLAVAALVPRRPSP